MHDLPFFVLVNHIESISNCHQKRFSLEDAQLLFDEIPTDEGETTEEEEYISDDDALFANNAALKSDELESDEEMSGIADGGLETTFKKEYMKQRWSKGEKQQDEADFDEVGGDFYFDNSTELLITQFIFQEQLMPRALHHTAFIHRAHSEHRKPER